MNDEYAIYVHPILTYGLEVRDRLDAGQEPSIEETQRDLKQLLLREVDSGCRNDVVGETEFLGLRFALICWLDEIFIRPETPWAETPWAKSWRVRSLEVAFHGAKNGAWKFPEQSEAALRTRNDDVVEAFFLCWMLGFRGELRHDLETLRRGHIEPARKTMERALTTAWKAPAGREPPIDVPPLMGREGFYRMLLVWVVTTLLLSGTLVVAYVASGP